MERDKSRKDVDRNVKKNKKSTYQNLMVQRDRLYERLSDFLGLEISERIRLKRKVDCFFIYTLPDYRWYLYRSKTQYD